MDHISIHSDFKTEFRPDPRKVSKFTIIVASLIVLFIIVTGVLNPVITYQWFIHDVRHPEVFTRRYEVESALFFFSFIATFIVFWFNFLQAVKLGSAFVVNADSRGVAVVAGLLNFVRNGGRGASRIISAVVALMFAGGFGANWNEYLLSSHAQSFGMKDPLFGLDLGFFLFKLPWLRAVTGYAFGVALFTTIVTIGIYVGLQALASLAKIEFSRPKIRQHLSMLIGFTLLVLAARLWLNRYDLVLADGEQFTGAGYTAVRQLVIQQIVAGLVAALALVTIVGGWVGQPFKLLLGGGVATVLFSIIGTGIYPAVIQRIYVEPNKIAAESPYAERAITMTRFGFGLDKIRMRDFSVQDRPSDADLAASRSTLDNMRLWDPTVLQTAMEQTQGLKGFYRFHDVDVDRYVINGREQTVMISPRDIYLPGLGGNANSWLYTKLTYTHGYGAVMAPVNTSTPMGLPDYLVRDMPVTSIPEIKIDRPQIYFSKFSDSNQDASDDYVLVHTNVEEFDYPSEDGDKHSRWEGDRGIPVSGLWDRIMFSAALGDGNLLVSSNIVGSTRLLMHRDIVDRASLLYPFLQFDSDPYLVALNGKLIWILDGYTASDKLPYSNHVAWRDGLVNYMRNPVKVTVDAYTGDVDAYAIDPNEPILKCWREVFPKLIKDASQMPAGLDAHLRYPEDMFTIQAYQLTQFHVTDPTTFLTNGDAWDMPFNRGTSGDKEPLRAYNVEIRLPDEPKDGFMLILPFTPRQKDNMSGWLAAHCDPGEYGKLVLYRFTKGSLVPGPAQMETFFNQDESVSYINRTFNNNQNKVLVGNLLVIPIGQSVMYAEPLFFQSTTTGIQAPPELKKVILAFNGKIVVGDSYSEALQKLIGSQPAKSAMAPPASANASTAPAAAVRAPSADEAALAKEVLGQMDQADQALRSGDFAKYGELQKKIKARLQQITAEK